MKIKLSEIESDKIKVCARTVESMNPVMLVWTGSFVELNLRASELKMLVEGPYTEYENWIAIEVNGEVISRRMVSNEREWITVFRMMNSQNPVRVRIIKEGQAFSSDSQHRINLYDLETDGELLSVDDDRMKIEFIGDSINSAEGCIGAKCEMDWIAQFFSHTNSYPYMVGKKMNADVRVFSQSGWGVYSSWDCNADNVIPKYYDEICSLMSPGFFDRNGFFDKWDFTKWQPDAVVINLGTNDDGAFHNNESDNFDFLRMEGDEYNEDDRIKVRQAMIDFLAQVRKNNPKAYIYWAYGMLGDKMADTICEAINIYRESNNDIRVKYISLPMTNDKTVGARCHPGKKAHKQAAKAIVRVLKKDN